MVEYRPLVAESYHLPEILELLRRVFPRARQFTLDYMNWMYCGNPLGPALGANAYIGGRLVGHVAAQRLVAEWAGQRQAGMLIHNVGTDPSFQGRGIFAQLLRECVEAGRASGCTHMVAVPNAQSTPGFLRSLQCQGLGALQARLGIGPLPSVATSFSAGYKRSWDSAQLAWRLSGPGKTYSAAQGWLMGRTGIPGIGVALSCAERGCLALPASRSFRPATLWIGLSPRLDWRGRAYFNIPQRFRPAPLNLVFLDLTTQKRSLDLAQVEFTALDFDVY